MSRLGMKASVFLAIRSDLLRTLGEIDAEIDEVLKHPKSKRAFERAKVLFAERKRIVDELVHFGVEAEPHHAVERA